MFAERSASVAARSSARFFGTMTPFDANFVQSKELFA
jgi:hypothetical protein